MRSFIRAVLIGLTTRLIWRGLFRRRRKRNDWNI
jgi:hypothetical protein